METGNQETEQAERWRNRTPRYLRAFFPLNAGIIVLVKPFPVEQPVLAFHFPGVLATTTVVSDIAVRRTIPRWAGLVLVLLYLGLVAGSDLVHRGPGALPRSRVRRPKGCRLSMCTRITDRRAAHGWRSQTDTPGRPAAGRRHRAGAGGGRLPSGPSTRRPGIDRSTRRAGGRDHPHRARARRARTTPGDQHHRLQRQCSSSDHTAARGAPGHCRADQRDGYARAGALARPDGGVGGHLATRHAGAATAGSAAERLRGRLPLLLDQREG